VCVCVVYVCTRVFVYVYHDSMSVCIKDIVPVCISYSYHGVHACVCVCVSVTTYSVGLTDGFLMSNQNSTMAALTGAGIFGSWMLNELLTAGGTEDYDFTLSPTGKIALRLRNQMFRNKVAAQKKKIAFGDGTSCKILILNLTDQHIDLVGNYRRNGTLDDDKQSEKPTIWIPAQECNWAFYGKISGAFYGVCRAFTYKIAGTDFTCGFEVPYAGDNCCKVSLKENAKQVSGWLDKRTSFRPRIGPLFEDVAYNSKYQLAVKLSRGTTPFFVVVFTCNPDYEKGIKK